MSNILKRYQVRRESFDPNNRAHLASFKHFIRTGTWGEVQFYPEAPYVDVTTSVLMKFAEGKTGVQRETREERLARIGSRLTVLDTAPEASEVPEAQTA